MRIVEINAMTYGSTGKIMIQIAGKAIENGHEIWQAYPQSRSNAKIEVENGKYFPILLTNY